MNSDIQKVLDLADKHHDGHVAFLRFTNGWKVVFGTPPTDLQNWQVLAGIPCEMSHEEACKFAVNGRPVFKVEE